MEDLVNFAQSWIAALVIMILHPWRDGAKKTSDDSLNRGITEPIEIVVLYNSALR